MKPKARNNLILSNLNKALSRASEFNDNNKPVSDFDISENLISFINLMTEASTTASSALTNIITALAVKVSFEDFDVRFHQTQIQDPVWFSLRPISEKVVYPWLRDNDFEGAKSGWQTRTFERPKPYYRDYDENIGTIKEPFLEIYNLIHEGANVSEALAYMIYTQMLLRDKKKIDLIAPATDEIAVITSFFEAHFFETYNGAGASRLPVLAIHALYSTIMPQLSRYRGKRLLPLESHSAADSQTGATGDIEICSVDDSVFEAMEIKHNIKIDENLIIDAAKKLISKHVNRYYILTTHQDCSPSKNILIKTKELRERTGCQIIVNGVIPTLKYYLRMLDNPADIFQAYRNLLLVDQTLSHEHRVRWNEIVLG